MLILSVAAIAAVMMAASATPAMASDDNSVDFCNGFPFCDNLDFSFEQGGVTQVISQSVESGAVNISFSS